MLPIILAPQTSMRWFFNVGLCWPGLTQLNMTLHILCVKKFIAVNFFKWIQLFHTLGVKIFAFAIFCIEISYWTWSFYTSGVKIFTASISSIETSNWTWRICTLGVKISTAVIFFIEVLNWTYMFTPNFHQQNLHVTRVRYFS